MISFLMVLRSRATSTGWLFRISTASWT